MKRWLLTGAGVVIVGLALLAPWRLVSAPADLKVLTSLLLPDASPVMLGFAGDIMLDRFIRKMGAANSYDFILARTTELLAKPDLTVANLEGPITENESVSLGVASTSLASFTFTFPPAAAAALAAAGLDLVSLGNNHSANFGPAGLTQTENFLTQAGVQFFGDPLNNQPFIKDVGGVKIGFLAFNQFAPEDPETFDNKLRSLASTTDFTVVFAHWGDEYSLVPNDEQRAWAREFIDAGADLVVGAHPHVIEPPEVYHGKMIYYSLGNFIFDQYFSTTVRCGLFLTIAINPRDLSYTASTTTIYLERTGQTVVKNCHY